MNDEPQNNNNYWLKEMIIESMMGYNVTMRTLIVTIVNSHYILVVTELTHLDTQKMFGTVIINH